ncbi:unnamed protein product [Linum trigynum]|uniref:Uncharacterized protein n=1 Tax=Linum trigynum TaxID=586398 RepID=A0AAV2F5V5_9ROSI
MDIHTLVWNLLTVGVGEAAGGFLWHSTSGHVSRRRVSGTVDGSWVSIDGSRMAVGCRREPGEFVSDWVWVPSCRLPGGSGREAAAGEWLGELAMGEMDEC